MSVVGIWEVISKVARADAWSDELVRLYGEDLAQWICTAIGVWVAVGLLLFVGAVEGR